MTYVIAYLRDYGCNFNSVAESFETAVPWSKVSTLCENVKTRLFAAAKKRGLGGNKVYCANRVTQVYDTGAAVYTYFGITYDGMPQKQIMTIYEEIEAECRDEILKCGGSISHHHGVGKIRKRFMKDSLSPLGLEMHKRIKEMIDPMNIFAINNTIYRSKEEEEHDLEHVKI